MKKHVVLSFLLRFRWFLLAFGFLLINTYGVLRWVASAENEGPASAASELLIETQPFVLTGSRQIAHDAEGRITIVLEFNAAPNVEDLKDKLTLQTKTGKLDFRFLSQTAGKSVLLEVEPTLATQLKIHIAGDVLLVNHQSTSSAAIDTHIDLHPRFAFSSLHSQTRAFEDGELDLYFSSALNLDSFTSFVSLEPELSFHITPLRSHRYGRGVKLTGAFIPGQVYTVRLKQGLAAADGRTLTDGVVKQVRFENRPVRLAWRQPGHRLSTRGKKNLTLSSVNVDACSVQAKRIYPNNVLHYLLRKTDGLYGYYGSDDQKLSHLVGAHRYAIASEQDRVVETAIDIQELMGEHDAGVFLVEASHKDQKSGEQLVVVSDLGVIAKVSRKGVLFWVNSIMGGRPVEGAEILLYSEENQELARLTTNAEGVALHGALTQNAFLAVIQHGDDFTYLRLKNNPVKQHGNIVGAPYGVQDEAFVFTERGIYRPGETVHIKAVVRAPDLGMPAAFPVELILRRPDNQQHFKGVQLVSQNGTVDFDVPLEIYDPTGKYSAMLGTPGAEGCLGQTQVSVEEFVPPTILVDVNPGVARQAADRRVPFTVSSRFLFGAPASHLPAEGWVDFRSVPFRHIDWPGWTFHNPQRKWGLSGIKLGTGSTDAAGRAQFDFTPPKDLRPPSAVKVIFGARVQEPSGRSTSGYSSRMIDYYPHYVGLKQAAETGRVSLGVAHRVDLAVVSPQGAAVPLDQLDLRLDLMDWASVLREENGSLRYHSERRATMIQQVSVPLDEGRGTFVYLPKSSGAYRLTATDPVTASSSVVEFYAGSPEDRWHSVSMAEPDRVELELDKSEYSPGETALLTLRSPYRGRALISVESNEPLYHTVIELSGNTQQINIPVKKTYLPNVYIQVNVLRPLEVGQPEAGCRASGILPLYVVQASDRLSLELDAPDHAAPSQVLTLKARVSQIDTNYPTEVVLFAVDEGICALTDYRTPDPLSFFRRKRGHGIPQADLYGSILPEMPQVSGAASAVGGGMGGALRSRLNPINARRFKSVALWSAKVPVDRSGCATTEFPVPEFSGELRFMAVAINGSRFASDSRPIKVGRDVVVQHGLARFLAPEDRCELPVFCFNTSAEQRAITLSISSEGPLTVGDFTNRLVLAAAGSRVLKVPLAAGGDVGKAVLHFDIESGSDAYRETVEISIRPPVARTVLSGSGMVGPGVSKTLTLPQPWLIGTAEYELLCSPLPAVDLQGGLDYLLRYPYGCLEQTTSSAFPLVFLPELINMAHPGSMTQEEVRGFVQAGIVRLLSMQKSNGGFNYWPGSDAYYEWGSLYATHFLVTAHAAGYDVPLEPLNKAAGFVQSIMASSARAKEPRQDILVRAYGAYILALAGHPDQGWLNTLTEQFDTLPGDAKTFLAHAQAVAGDRRLARELLSKISPDVPPQALRQVDGALCSPVRSDALLLLAWLEVDPESPAVVGLAQRIGGLRTKMRWGSTQENAMALMALGRYAQCTQGPMRPVSGQVDGGAKQWPLHARKSTRIPLESSIPPSFRIDNSGPGNLYYFWNSSGVLKQGGLPAMDQGVVIRRTYYDLDHQPLDSNTLNQGQLVVVQLDVKSQGGQLENLVITDLLPAGLEIENPKLATSQTVPWLKGSKNHDIPLRHLEVRDDRLLAFPGKFMNGSMYYLARAVTPGTYSLPPVSAECMYDESIKSIHGAGILVIKAKDDDGVL